MLDLALLDSATASSDRDQNEFMNVAAYSLRFGHHLYTEDLSTASQTSSLIDQLAAIAVRGFSAVAYLGNISSLSDGSDHDRLTAMKAFGSWMSLIAAEFWNSMDSTKRREVSKTAAKQILASNSVLAAQAMEFLQYDLDSADFLIDGLRYDNQQLIAMLCSASALLESHGSYPLPDSMTPRVVSGYLHIAASNVVKRLSAFDWLITVKTEFLDDKMLFSW